MVYGYHAGEQLNAEHYHRCHLLSFFALFGNRSIFILDIKIETKPYIISGSSIDLTLKRHERIAKPIQLFEFFKYH